MLGVYDFLIWPTSDRSALYTVEISGESQNGLIVLTRFRFVGTNTWEEYADDTEACNAVGEYVPGPLKG